MRFGPVDLDERVAVVAEIGNNHEGSLERARELVEAAASAGADAVKFQTFRTELFVSRSAEERFRRLEGFRLSDDAFRELADLAHARGLAFVSTPLDLESGRFLLEIADAVKVASGDNDFRPLLEELAGSDKPLIVSTGLADLELVAATVAFVEQVRGSHENVALLHCTSAYPAPEQEVNLRAIATLAERFPGWTVGYSDHALGIDAAVLAVAAGARIVEKHFTLDKELSDFRDHRLSADPDDLGELVRRVRATETLLGSKEKRVQPSEADGVTAYRRSAVAVRDLPAGHQLAVDDVVWLRPGGGVPASADAIGKRLGRDVASGEQITAADLD